MSCLERIPLTGSNFTMHTNIAEKQRYSKNTDNSTDPMGLSIFGIAGKIRCTYSPDNIAGNDEIQHRQKIGLTGGNIGSTVIIRFYCHSLIKIISDQYHEQRDRQAVYQQNSRIADHGGNGHPQSQ